MHIERTRPAILSGVKREERRGEGHNECGLPVIVHAGSKGRASAARDGEEQLEVERYVHDEIAMMDFRLNYATEK